MDRKVIFNVVSTGVFQAGIETDLKLYHFFFYFYIVWDEIFS